MNLIVGGAPKEYKDGLTVSELIDAEKVRTPMYVTIAVNDEFVQI